MKKAIPYAPEVALDPGEMDTRSLPPSAGPRHLGGFGVHGHDPRSSGPAAIAPEASRPDEGQPETGVEGASPPPWPLDRFTGAEFLGSGGMGMVYAARDEVLGRRVAIKLLQEPRDEADRRRIKRESRAMARLSHPAVCQIYEVIETDDQVLLVMELVLGERLDAWLETRRSWRELCRMFVEIGKGLAAAHDAGFIHRDFKPGNVIVGYDGRPRIIDFGLARTPGPLLREAPSHVPEVPHMDEALTEAGTIVGTPIYMAPEQYHGESIDARADQFSFCVVFFEALFGAAPYCRKSTASLLLSIADHAVAPAPAGSSVPSWLHGVLKRGLDPEPERRWPDMPRLIEELSRDRLNDPRTGRTQRLRFLAGMAGAALAVTLIAIARSAPVLPSQAEAVTYSAVVFALSACAVLAGRASIEPSALSRMLARYILVSTGYVLGVRSVWYIAEHSPASMYAGELIGLAGLSVLSASPGFVWLYGVAAVFAAGAVTVAVSPSSTSLTYAAVLVVVFLLAFGAIWRQGRSAAPGAGGWGTEGVPPDAVTARSARPGRPPRLPQSAPRERAARPGRSADLGG